MAAGGEEMRFRLTPIDAPDFMRSTGWSLNELLSGPQLRDKYLAETKLGNTDVTTSAFAVVAST
jgi:hypothetical protein